MHRVKAEVGVHSPAMAYHRQALNHARMLNPAPDPFKTNRSPGSLAQLGGFSLLSCKGPDAAAFLQAQTINDVRTLSPMHWHWNGWLNPKGRLIALFALLQLEAAEFIAILPDFPAVELQPLLQRYVFRSKLTLQQVISHVVATDRAFPERATTAQDVATTGPTGIISLDFSGDAAQRHLLLVPCDSPVLAPPDSGRDAQWLAADIAHGLPRLPVDQREMWTPQMLSLDRLHAFSLAKGCYPGQEIVARTHYLGQAKRGLRRVLGIGLRHGGDIRNEHGAVVGTVFCVAADGLSALAVTSLEALTGHAVADGQPVLIVEPVGGLQRPV